MVLLIVSHIVKVRASGIPGRRSPDSTYPLTRVEVFANFWLLRK